MKFKIHIADFIFSIFTYFILSTFSSEHVITFKDRKINVINFYISLPIFIALFLNGNQKKKNHKRLKSLGLNARTNNESGLAVTVAQSMNWIRKVSKA